jgi:AcrR family transcriptional regulator
MTKRRRFSTQDWITLGQQALAEHGTEAVKLEAICAAAGLTRGSFYYHFKDHTAFLVALADAWAQTQTADLLEGLGAEPESDAEHLTERALTIDFKLEIGIRELARRIPEVADIVKMTDATRLEALATLHRERFGVTPERAADLAFIEYAAYCGMILVQPDLPPDRQQKLAAMFEGMVRRFVG